MRLVKSTARNMKNDDLKSNGIPIRNRDISRTTVLDNPEGWSPRLGKEEKRIELSAPRCFEIARSPETMNVRLCAMITSRSTATFAQDRRQLEMSIVCSIAK
jgi:hypothetical protein